MSDLRMGRIVRPAMLAILLAACQPAPQLPLMTPIEIAGQYGYGEKTIAPGRYEVTYLSPARPTGFEAAKRDEDADRLRTLARDLALWRAAEIALAQSAPAFHVADSKSDARFDTREQTYYPPYYASPYPPFYPPLVDARRRAVYPYAYDDLPVYFRSTWVQARATLTIELRQQAEGPDTYEAAAVLRQMRSKYSPSYEQGS